MIKSGTEPEFSLDSEFLSRPSLECFLSPGCHHPPPPPHHHHSTAVWRASAVPIKNGLISSPLFTAAPSSTHTQRKLEECPPPPTLPPPRTGLPFGSFMCGEIRLQQIAFSAQFLTLLTGSSLWKEGGGHTGGGGAASGEVEGCFLSRLQSLRPWQITVALEPPPHN